MSFKDSIQFKSFIVLVFAIFTGGTLLLVLVQYYGGRNSERMISKSQRLIRDLQVTNHLHHIEQELSWVNSQRHLAAEKNQRSYLLAARAAINLSIQFMRNLNEKTVNQSERKDLSAIEALLIEQRTALKWMEDAYRKNGRIEDPRGKTKASLQEDAEQINVVMGRIYAQRDKTVQSLNQQVDRSVADTRFWDTIMIFLLFFSGGACCWFIVNRVMLQNKLIAKLDSSERTSREAAKMKENFIANMSHEIRTPLNSILGFTNLLLNESLAQKPKEFISAIQKSGENLLSIINDILDISKIQAGMICIEQHPFSVRGLTESISTLFSGRIQEKGLTLSIETDLTLPDTLIGDATRLTQILVNLIGNAIKFTDKGSIEVAVNWVPTDKDHINLSFRITDSGIGIMEEKQAYIFDRFRQAEDSTTRNYGGSGLGLSIVKDLIELQQGSINVQSIPGKGTSFYFTIPYLVATQQIVYSAKDRTRSLEPYLPGTIRLLVLDDNLMNQSLMHHLLESWALDFDIVGDARSGIALMQKKHYDLILMDIQMPGMDGYQATRYIRTRLASSVPIIAMTAHALAGEREKCLSFGMNEYLSKPINEKQLHNFINRFATSTTLQNTRSAARISEKNQQEASPIEYFFIDLSYMHQISKGDTGYEKRVTGQFLEIVPLALDELSRAMQQKDFELVAKIAHELRSSLSIMGMLPKAEDMLDTLEYSKNVDQFEQVMQRLDELCRNAMDEAHFFFLLLENLETQ